MGMSRIAIDSELASRVREVLRAIVRDLAATIESKGHAETLGLSEAIAEVLIAVRDLDQALPDHERDRVVEPLSVSSLRPLESGSAAPIRLQLDSARALVVIVLEHARALDRLIADVMNQTSPDLRKQTVRYFGQIMGLLYTEIMHPLHVQHRELESLFLGRGTEEERDDGGLTEEQRAAIGRLTACEIETIDRALLTNVPKRWRKVAMVVAKTMSSLADERFSGIPDVYYAERIRSLASKHMIESVGNLRRMRFSEVRLPDEDTRDDRG